MHLYVVRFSDNSYQVVIRANSHKEAQEKAIKYIEQNHSWYIKDYRLDDINVSLLDEDYIIE